MGNKNPLYKVDAGIGLDSRIFCTIILSAWFLILLVYKIIFVYEPSSQIKLIFDTIGILLFALVIVLIFFEKYKLSRILFFVAVGIVLFYTCSVFGKGTGFQHLYLASAIGPFVLYCNNEFKQKIFSLLILLTSLVLLETIGYKYYGTTENVLTTGQTPISASIFTVLLVIVYIVFYSRTHHEDKSKMGNQSNRIENNITNRTYQLVKLLKMLENEVVNNKSVIEKLKKTEQQLNTAIHSSKQAQILANSKGIVETINDSAIDLFNKIYGCSLDVGSDILNFHHENGGNAIIHLFDSSLKGKSNKFDFEYISDNLKKNRVEYRLSPILIENNISGIFICIQEIASIKTGENEINHLKSEFLSSVSHELRTPLTKIYSNVQVVEKYAGKWEMEKLKKSYSRIYGAIKSMEFIINEANLLQKSNQGIESEIFAETSLESICLDSINKAKSFFIHVNNPIHFSLNSNVERFMTNEGLLKNVLVSIMANALKLSISDNPVCFTVTNAGDSKLKFTITDSGKGINKDELNKILENFYKGINSHNFSTTGLWLAVARKCIKPLNGEINIASEINNGTEVEVTIPIGNSFSQS